MTSGSYSGLYRGVSFRVNASVALRAACGPLGRVGRSAFACMARMARMVSVGWVACLLAACSVYDPKLVQDDNNGLCKLKTIPTPPKKSDSSNNQQDVWFVLKDATFKQAGAVAEEIAYDLDGRCTVLPDLDSECLGTTTISQDGPLGQDNSLGQNMLSTLLLKQPGAEASWRDAQAKGVSALALRIRNWNGTADDPAIRVDLAHTAYGVPSGASPTPGSTPLDASWTAPPPSWDGTDVFALRRDDFVTTTPDVARAADDNAYIAGGVIVAKMPERTGVRIHDRTRTWKMTLTSARLVATLSDDFKTVQGATYTGRWPTITMYDELNYGGFCGLGTAAGDPLLSQALLDGADVFADPDVTPVGQPCDAVTIALSFSGPRASIESSLVNGIPYPKECANATIE
jgi:hypothetical protein